jgi:hypothetical protein
MYNLEINKIVISGIYTIHPRFCEKRDRRDSDAFKGIRDYLFIVAIVDLSLPCVPF